MVPPAFSAIRYPLAACRRAKNDSKWAIIASKERLDLLQYPRIPDSPVKKVRHVHQAESEAPDRGHDHPTFTSQCGTKGRRNKEGIIVEDGAWITYMPSFPQQF